MTANNNAWPTRFYILDVSRGFAALSVVLWHWHHFAYNGTRLPEDFSRENQPLYIILKLFYEKGGMGVQYFFLLSGFIFYWLYMDSIQKKRTSSLEFIVNRFSRLYPLHLATLLVVGLLQLSYISRETIFFVYPYNDVYHFFLNLFFASSWGFESGWSFNAPVWSVSIEILLYSIFFLLSTYRQGSCKISLAISLVSFLIYYFAGNKIFNGLALFFLGGSMFHLTLLISTRKVYLTKLVYIVCIIAWVFVIINFYVFNLSSSFLKFGAFGKIFLKGYPNFILFPSTLCCLTLLEINKGSLLKPISWIGDITYSSYLLHFPLQLTFMIFLSHNVISPDFYLDPAYLLLYFVILIPLSYIIYIKFERPIQGKIRKLALNSKRP